jgi:tRNA-dihydrouridine synthase
MRRHYTNYLRGLPNIKEYRTKLVTINDTNEIDEVLNEVEVKYQGYEFQPRSIDMNALSYSCD